ncbi:MAG: hypothetical protein AAFN09_17675, partial [Pseudomonadota bacterium]
MEDVYYYGVYHQYIGGWSVMWMMFRVTISSVEDVYCGEWIPFNIVEDIQYCGRSSVLWMDTISTMNNIKYCGGKPLE